MNQPYAYICPSLLSLPPILPIPWLFPYKWENWHWTFVCLIPKVIHSSFQCFCLQWVVGWVRFLTALLSKQPGYHRQWHRIDYHPPKLVTEHGYARSQGVPSSLDSSRHTPPTPAIGTNEVLCLKSISKKVRFQCSMMTRWRHHCCNYNNEVLPKSAEDDSVGRS